METRRSFIEVNYEGVNISKEIQGDLLSFTYTDNASGAADDVSIMLKDDKLKWLNDWFPEKGDTIVPVIKTINWRKDGDSQSLDCGSFIIDEPSCSGPPSKIDIKGNSMPSNSNFKETKHTKSWSHINLDMIGKDIANNSGLNFYFESDYNPHIKYVLQEKEEDSKFLMDLCDEYGFGFKISNKTVILYSISEYEAKKEVAVINRNNSNVISYNLGTTLTGTAYSTVKMRYKDEIDGELKWYIYKLGNPKKEKNHKISEVAEDYAAAEKATLIKFRELNKNEFRASFTIVGNLEIIGASCVVLEEFGRFDGKYFIDQATHAITSGYTTSFEARKVVKVSVKTEIQSEQVESQVVMKVMAPSESTLKWTST